jgi:hypothetical protein
MNGKLKKRIENTQVYYIGCSSGARQAKMRGASKNSARDNRLLSHGLERAGEKREKGGRGSAR